MRRRLRLLAPLLASVLALLLLALAGCGAPPGPASSTGGDPAGAENEPPSPKEEEEPSEHDSLLTLIYSHPPTGLTVGVPEGWELYPLEDAVAAMISPERGEEDFFRENVLITADDQFPDVTLDTYTEALAEEVRSRYSDTETLESGDITISGVEGRWMVDRFTGEKGEARVYRVVLVRGSTAYVLHGTAPVWTFEDYRPIFEAVARSITWVEPRTATEGAKPGAAGDQP